MNGPVSELGLVGVKGKARLKWITVNKKREWGEKSPLAEWASIEINKKK